MPVTGKLDGIKTTIKQTTGLLESFVDDVDLRLGSLGYDISDSDDWLAIFVIQKVVNEIKNECNVTAIPEGLYQVAVDMVCGEFLLGKKGSGQLYGFNVDMSSGTLKQIQEGDTNVVFATPENASPEKRLDTAIDSLINNGRRQFITYRRLKWT